MKVLILGSTGMAGQALVAEGRKRGLSVLGSARSGTDFDVDITDYAALSAMLERAQPNLVINSAASVSNLECERDPGFAYRINGRPAGTIAEYAKKTGASFVQISTDHFFTGGKNAKHDESAPITLVNEYARSKFVGEALAATDPRALIVRTNVVGFRRRSGQPAFVEWALKTLRERQPINLFNDFYTSSLDVTHFSAALFDLIESKASGLYNLASCDVSSKETFIRALAARFGLDASYATVGSVADKKDTRHAESLGLDVSKAEARLGRKLPTLEEVIEQLFRDQTRELKFSGADL